MKNSHKPDGFTIIEILIVIAIAGLILAIILITLPTLMRNKRNYIRRNAVDYVAGLMEEYKSMHSAYPMSGPDISNPVTDKRDDFVSQLQTDQMTKLFTIRYIDRAGDHRWPYAGYGAPANLDEALDTISIQPGHYCNRGAHGDPGVDPDYPLISTDWGSDTNFGHYTVLTLLEGGQTYCIDNN